MEPSEQNGLHASMVEKDNCNLDMSKETELELGLGLSLGGGGGGVGGGAWGGEYYGTGRILTAKDFPRRRSSCNNVSAGTKRERASNSSDAAGEDTTGSASAVSQVVGWPPLRAYRLSTLVNQSKTSNAENDKGVGGNEKKENSNKKTNHGSDKNDVVIKERGNLGFVKVNMDGLPIGRKVDLNAQKNYETLAKMLVEMFFKPSATILGSGGGNEKPIQLPKLLDGSSEFVLTYEDKEGDWMLVGDVPWRMFLNTVKRLRIMKTSEANGLAPKIQESNEKQNCRPI